MAGDDDDRRETREEQLLRQVAALQAELAALQAQHVRLQGVEEELRQTRRAADAASEAKDQFVAVLSHELRTPLTPVLATVELIEGDPRLPADLRADVRLIRRNVQLEARLVDDLLDLAGIGSGSLRLHFEAVDAHAVARGAVEVARPDVERKKQTIRFDLAAAESRVWADPARLQQAVCNLVRNAVKFTPEGGEITVRSGGGGGQLLIRVIDTGIGIEAEYLGRIFGAFDRGDTTVVRHHGGVGLGLTISKTLIDAHGGRLGVESRGTGGGTTFTVTLPTVAAPAVRGDRPGAAAGEPRPLRVLLVEDHEDTRRIMARLLRSYGYTVATAGDVKTALREAEAAEFDLLISDIGLPDGSGWDLVRDVLAKRSVKAIAVSGYGTEADVERSREAGFSTHLTKPIDPKSLGEVIERVTG